MDGKSIAEFLKIIILSQKHFSHYVHWNGPYLKSNSIFMLFLVDIYISLVTLPHKNNNENHNWKSESSPSFFKFPCFFWLPYLVTSSLKILHHMIILPVYSYFTITLKLYWIKWLRKITYLQCFVKDFIFWWKVFEKKINLFCNSVVLKHCYFSFLIFSAVQILRLFDHYDIFMLF